MTIESIAALSGVVINLGIALIMFWTMREMRMAMYAEAYKAARDILQDEAVRSHRRKVFQNLGDEDGNLKKKYEEWSTEEKASAEIVCHTYDAVAQMIRAKILPERLIADSWGYSLRSSWKLLKPLVMNRREKGESWEIWDDFEWLAGQAESYQKKTFVLSTRGARSRIVRWLRLK